MCIIPFLFRTNNYTDKGLYNLFENSFSKSKLHVQVFRQHRLYSSVIWFTLKIKSLAWKLYNPKLQSKVRTFFFDRILDWVEINQPFFILKERERKKVNRYLYHVLNKLEITISYGLGGRVAWFICKEKWKI